LGRHQFRDSELVKTTGIRGLQSLVMMSGVESDAFGGPAGAHQAQSTASDSRPDRRLFCSGN